MNGKHEAEPVIKLPSPKAGGKEDAAGGAQNTH